MRLLVTPDIAYVVTFVADLRDEDGETVWGECDHAARLIRLWAGMPIDDLDETLLHEYGHAYAERHGLPHGTSEQFATSASRIGTAFQSEFLRAGGRPKLMLARARAWMEAALTPKAVELITVTVAEPPGGDLSIDPLRIVYGVELPRGRTSNQRRECLTCGGTINAAAIVDSDPVFSPFEEGRVVERMLYCGHCDAIQVWTEGVGNNDKANGVAVSKTTYITDSDAIVEFLRKHPFATGLVTE